MEIRELQQNELNLIWTIDRSEFIENVYRFRDGRLILEPHHFNVTGWLPDMPEQYKPILAECFERGGVFYGAFEDETLVGISVLDNAFLGLNKDQLQLKFLYTNQSHRKRGLGRKLFTKAADAAKALNARKLYISAAPSENTVNFYRRLGCEVTKDVDPALFELEPEDIHMEYVIP